jgi:hypothetical protein
MKDGLLRQNRSAGGTPALQGSFMSEPVQSLRAAYSSPGRRGALPLWLMVFPISNEVQLSPTMRARRPRSPFFLAKEHWSAGVPPAMRAEGSRTAASFLAARVAFAIRPVHCARTLNFVANQDGFSMNISHVKLIYSNRFRGKNRQGRAAGAVSPARRGKVSVFPGGKVRGRNHERVLTGRSAGGAP